jgi:hypothetical protein
MKVPIMLDQIASAAITVLHQHLGDVDFFIKGEHA